MKKIIYLTLLTLLLNFSLFAQWTDNGTNLTATDNVGIGTASPASKLDVHGEIKFNGGTQNFTISNLTGTETGFGDFVNYGGIAINGNNGSNRQMFMFSDGASSHNVFTIATSTNSGSTWNPRFVVQQTGNVGIGLASPTRRLDVSGTARIETGTTFDFQSDKFDIYGNNNPATIRILGGSNGSNSATINVGSNDGRAWEMVAKAYNAPEGYALNFNHKTADYQGPVIYSWNNIEKFRIEPDGNVGIGTTAPNSKLHITSSDYRDFLILDRTDNSNIQNVFHLTPSWDSDQNDQLRIGTDNIDIISFEETGNVGIGTKDPISKLSVNGNIRATEVKVLTDISVPDYVFESDYELRTLLETKKYITEHKHLPEIPSAAEIGENGIDLGDMNMRLLKKIEELTLYQIELMEEMETMKKELEELKSK